MQDSPGQGQPFCTSGQRLAKKLHFFPVATSDGLCELELGLSMSEHRTFGFYSMSEVYRTEIPVESKCSWVLFIFDWKET